MKSVSSRRFSGILGRAMPKPKLAAAYLMAAHEKRERFTPLPEELAPRTAAEAYAIQDSYVALRAENVAAVMPAIEIADDRNADYSRLARHPLELIADNGWNEGAVLGVPVENWRSLDLAALRGVATINGDVVGEGVGAAAMSHPLEALAWVANHLAAEDRGLVFRDVVITGSMITTKTVKPGDAVRFEAERLGSVGLAVD